MATNLMMTGIGDAGNVIPVPKQIPNLLYWFDANAGTFQNAGLTTPASANNDPIGGWKDQSGNGNDATQATGSARPLLQTNQQNGLSTVLSDGLSQTVNFSQSLEFDATTWFFVLKTVAFGGFITGGFFNSTASGVRFSNSTTAQVFGSGGIQALGILTPMSTTAYQISEITTDTSGNTFAHYLNGSANGTGPYAAGSVSHASIASRNAGNFMNGYIGEVGAYSRALSGTEITSLYNYLHAKWNI